MVFFFFYYRGGTGTYCEHFCDWSGALSSVYPLLNSTRVSVGHWALSRCALVESTRLHGPNAGETIWQSNDEKCGEWYVCTPCALKPATSDQRPATSNDTDQRPPLSSYCTAWVDGFKRQITLWRCTIDFIWRAQRKKIVTNATDMVRSWSWHHTDHMRAQGFPCSSYDYIFGMREWCISQTMCAIMWPCYKSTTSVQWSYIVWFVAAEEEAITK